MIRELREEIEALRAGGATLGVPGAANTGGGGGSGVNAELQKKLDEQKERAEALRLEVEREEAEFQARIAEEAEKVKKAAAEAEHLKITPQIRNINPDDTMSGTIKVAFREGENVAGKKNNESPPDLPLSGAGIRDRHCVFEFQGNQCTVLPNDSPEQYKIKVNGDLLLEPRELVHKDRILIGTHHYYVYVDPKEDCNDLMDYDTAVAEAHAQELALEHKAQQEEADAKAKEMEEKI